MEDRITEKAAMHNHAPDTKEVLLKANVFVPVSQIQLKSKNTYLRSRASQQCASQIIWPSWVL